MANLVNLYRAARLGEREAARTGSVGALGEYGNSLVRRRRLLEQNIRSGVITTDELGDADRRIISAPVSTGGLSFGLTPNVSRDVGGGGGKSFFGLIGNLGEDMYAFGKGFFPGLYEAGKAIGHDVTHPFGGDNNRFMETVVEPTWEGLKTDVSNIAHGRWDEIYEHPLNPLLTVASGASLGAGGVARAGSVAERVAGAESAIGRAGARAASITSREGRPSVFTGTTEIPRNYSTRPLANLSQRIFDQAAPRRFQEYLARTSTMRRNFVQNQMESALAAARAALPVNKELKNLTPVEAEALQYMWGDVRTPNEVAAYADALERTLNGQASEGYNFTDIFEDPESANAQTYLRETQRKIQGLRGSVGERITNPTENMIRANNVWHGSVDKGRAEMELPDDIHNEMLDRQRQMVDEMLAESGLERGDVPETGIEPTYSPRRSLLGREWHEPNTLQQFMGAEPGLRPAKYEPRETDVTPENIARPNAQAYLHSSSGEAFRTGNYRVDAKNLVDHIRQRERDLHENLFKRDFINEYAFRYEDPETYEYKTLQGTKSDTRRELAKHEDPKDWEFVPSNGFERQWINAEHNMAAELVNRAHYLADNGILPENPAFVQELERLAGENAEHFMRQEHLSLQAPGVWIPKKVFNYQRDLIRASDPMTRGGLKQYQRFINTWRRATLTWMPRWALNTAVGSFIQAMVSGAVNPKNYFLAHQLRKRGELPAGVELGRSATREMIDDPTGWLERNTGLKGGYAEKVAGVVQAIEDFFRGGVFITKLRREGRLSEVRRLDSMGDTLQNFYRRGLSDSETVGQFIRDNPTAVHEALKETDKFMYNFMALGPTERRYVRQFIPFWGWYKFITKLTWRLPIEYPGRAWIMNNLAAVGNEQLGELGPIPSWLQGAIMLNYQGGVLNYLSGQGVNPFSGFANPAALFSDTGQSGANAAIELGQFSPLIQAGLSFVGVDPYSAGAVAVSPESGYSRDWAGNLVNMRTGETRTAGDVNPLQRFFMSLARSFPQVRIAERAAMGGAQPYPESVPLPGMMRPMYMPEDQPVSGEAATVLDLFGLKPRGYNLQRYQEQLPKRQEYAQSFAESQMKRLRKSLQGTP